MKSQEIAELNTWWKLGKDFHAYDINLKTLKSKLVTFHRSDIELKPGSIYIIRGPRQVGKTVWIKQAIQKLIERKTDPKSIFYLSCDLLTGKTRKELHDALRFYMDNVGIDKRPLYIFLDEISAVEDWSVELKTMADNGALENCTIVVTGSNPWKIKNKRERLPGRGVEGNERIFFPLSFREFALHLENLPNLIDGANSTLIASLRKFCADMDLKNPPDIENPESITVYIRKIIPYQRELQYLFNMYLRTGGFPEAINSYLSNRYTGDIKEEKIDNRIYERFIDVIRGDLAELVRNEASLRELMDAVAKQQGNRYNYSDIVEDLSTKPDPKTATTYAELLKETLLVRMLYAYDFTNGKIRPRAEKKIYFYDPFLYYSVRSWLSGKQGSDITSEIMMNDEVVSAIVEGIVGNHLALVKESSPMKEMLTFLWFYYDSSREIDFLFKKEDDSFTGFEVKYQNNVSSREISPIDRVKEYFLISKDSIDLNKLPIIPVPMFLFSIQKSNGHI